LPPPGLGYWQDGMGAAPAPVATLGNEAKGEIFSQLAAGKKVLCTVQAVPASEMNIPTAPLEGGVSKEKNKSNND